ncbi:RsmD family RNA methyltransferase [Candidatus Zinderia endosymbiont of Aphrophora alni]|uniref:RsmD family RNA methyltransferase n=1 Tax=Candidatus Zinderia endosymbiont of Aphrophora alni TaxID=3077951 RepID=UPI0030CD979A
MKYLKLKKKKKNKRIRLISGKWKGILLPSLKKTFLRPTLTRVKGVLFDWIDNLINNNWSIINCIDLFAGSGSLSFEAASRGSKKVFLIEKNKNLVNKLFFFKKYLNASNVFILKFNSFFFLRRSIFYLKKNKIYKKFNLIFLDPPFYKDFLPKMIFFCLNLITNDGFLYVELEHSINELKYYKCMLYWEIINFSKTKKIYFYILKKKNIII